MTRWSIRWLLLGVATASLLLPLLSLLVLRLIDPYLVQQTERELRVEAALVAEMYHSAWALGSGQPRGNPRPPSRATHSFVTLEPQLRDLNEFAPRFPEELPARTRPPVVPIDGAALSETLRSAQVFNLSGVRVLDEHGCVVASSREQLDRCLFTLPEVKGALAGKYVTVLRQRESDEPAPPFGSLSRRGDVRVFVAWPVFDRGQQIGAVWLSRTAESSLEFLFKQRRGLVYGGLALMGVILGVSALFARLIVRPLERMARSAKTLTQNDRAEPLADIPAPREIHALGSALDHLTERLRARARYVSDFAANVSHELKTPLTSIRGATELLRESETMSEEQRQRFLANIDAAVRRTERLVERLLLLARLENQETVARDDDVTIGDWLDSRSARFDEHVQLELLGDVRSTRVSSLDLDSILLNLIDNALRVRRLAPVRVTLAARDGHVAVTVVDDGPGISPENQARLFERFFTTERDRGGTGLGLSIVKAAAERRGGNVSIDSSNAGTRVDVEFRAAPDTF